MGGYFLKLVENCLGGRKRSIEAVFKKKGRNRITAKTENAIKKKGERGKHRSVRFDPAFGGGKGGNYEVGDKNSTTRQTNRTRYDAIASSEKRTVPKEALRQESAENR